jgi:hypothetical protein
MLPAISMYMLQGADLSYGKAAIVLRHLDIA